MSSAGIRRTGQRGEWRGKQREEWGIRILASTYCRITEGHWEATGKTSKKRERGESRGTGWRREKLKRGDSVGGSGGGEDIDCCSRPGFMYYHRGSVFKVQLQIVL